MEYFPEEVLESFHLGSTLTQIIQIKKYAHLENNNLRKFYKCSQLGSSYLKKLKKYCHLTYGSSRCFPI